MADKEAEVKKPHIQVKTFPVTADGSMSVADARKALAAIVNAIPEAQLKNFRGGQVLIVH